MTPNAPATPSRSIRISDELWGEILRLADDLGETATDVVIRALKAYVRR